MQYGTFGNDVYVTDANVVVSIILNLMGSSAAPMLTTPDKLFVLTKRPIGCRSDWRP